MIAWRSWFRALRQTAGGDTLRRSVMTAGSFTMCGDTDVGKMRATNEDALFYDPLRGLAVVVDGLGGHAAGEIASALAIAVVEERLTRERLQGIFAGDQQAAAVELSSCFRQMNRSILTQSLTHRGWAGMGCTGVVALFDDHLLHVANLGDSRAYLLRNGTARLLTCDHTVAALRREEGTLDSEEARHHPCRNQLTACLGTPLPVPPAYTRLPLSSGDRVLLCSDGLWDMLPDEEITRLATMDDVAAAVGALIDAANAAGGSDNITVVVTAVG